MWEEVYKGTITVEHMGPYFINPPTLNFLNCETRVLIITVGFSKFMFMCQECGKNSRASIEVIVERRTVRPGDVTKDMVMMMMIKRGRLS